MVVLIHTKNEARMQVLNRMKNVTRKTVATHKLDEIHKKNETRMLVVVVIHMKYVDHVVDAIHMMSETKN